MNFEIAQNKNEAIVKTKVEKLDASNAPELKAELTLLNKQGVNMVVIDMSATRYCDSSGLSAVLTANRLCKDTNGKFVLCGLQESVLKLVQIAQLDKVLSISENEQQALDVIRK